MPFWDTIGRVAGSTGKWLTANPRYTQAIAGGISGYITSGGSGVGLLAGAGMGALGTAKTRKLNPTAEMNRHMKEIHSIIGQDPTSVRYRSHHTPGRTRYGSLGTRYGNPGFKSGRRKAKNILVPQTLSKTEFAKAEQSQSRAVAILSQRYSSARSATERTAQQWYAGRSAIKGGIQGGLTGLGLSALRGISSGASSLGNTFGSSENAPYGSTFTGMGNGQMGYGY